MTKNALITGANRGIGKAIAFALAQEDINTAITYKTDKKKAMAVVKTIRDKGKKSICLKLNQKNKSNIDRVIKEVEKKLGKINILVNNGAISQRKPFIKITDKDWDEMMAVNLRGPFSLCQAVIPNMVKQGWGRIVNISSIGGQWGGFYLVHYAAAKAALISLTRSLARIYSRDGITTNAIAPGLVLTRMVKPILKTKVGQKEIEKIPIGRVATTKEIADVVAFLCSEEASYITGQTINVNGGMYFG